MERVRHYGMPPYRVAVVHGGPGAGGEMAPVARALARERGVLEPIQTATSIDGQVEELRIDLVTQGAPPLVLVGHSWGAWLIFILAAHHSRLVEKLVLVGSGPFEEAYVRRLHETRMGRLGEEERETFNAAVHALEDPTTKDRDAWLARLGTLAGKADAYDPITDRSEEADRIGPTGDVFRAVWAEATRLRQRGELLALGRAIECPVVAIHGDYDPHPVEGVQEPLSAILECFRFVLLSRCGHKPWIERQARQTFFDVLEEELI